MIIHAALDRMRMRGGKQIDQDAHDEFGAVLTTEVRDRASSWVEKFESGAVRSGPDRGLHQEISALSADEVGACRHLARRLIDEAIHNVLWMIEQSERFDLVTSTDEGGSISLREAGD